MILESWERCRAFEVDYARAHLVRLPLAELAQVLERDAPLVQAARPHLSWALAAMQSVSPVAITLANADGIVLESTTDVPEMLAGFGLLPGYDWSERSMGTNGLGTAIATGETVAIVGPEHYIACWHNHTCVGAPIRDPQGRIVGAVDISTAAAERDPARILLTSFLAHCIARDLGCERTSFPEPQVMEKACASANSAEVIERQAAELAALADRLLECAQLHTRRVCFERAPVPLSSILERLASAYGNVRFVDATSREVTGRWEPHRLEQALALLVRSAGRNASEVEVRVAADHDRVRITLRGIDHRPESLARGWNIERAGPALSVWMARELVGALGGRVEELRDDGVGFLLELPLVAEVAC